MRSRILAALAVTGLLMTAIPLAASAADQATCFQKPGWGYQHPGWYRNWRKIHCSSAHHPRARYSGNQNGWGPFAFGQNQGAGYYANNLGYYASNNARYDNDADDDNGRRGAQEYRHRGHDGKRWSARDSRHCEFRSHHEHR
jgi:hypothetical protein